MLDSPVLAGAPEPSGSPPSWCRTGLPGPGRTAQRSALPYLLLRLQSARLMATAHPPDLPSAARRSPSLVPLIFRLPWQRPRSLSLQRGGRSRGINALPV